MAAERVLPDVDSEEALVVAGVSVELGDVPAELAEQNWSSPGVCADPALP